MLAQDIVQKMYDNDAFSQWLGIEIEKIELGYARIKMCIRPEMLNGFGIVHGGVSYSFADSAFAFASNSHGRMAVSIETSITHTAPLKAGDVIIAEATLENLTHKTGVYRVIVRKEVDNNTQNQDTNGAVVAVFKGVVYRKEKNWE